MIKMTWVVLIAMMIMVLMILIIILMSPITTNGDAENGGDQDGLVAVRDIHLLAATCFHHKI